MTSPALEVVYGKFSRNYARTVSEAGEGYPDYELVFEWNYKIQMTKFAFVQPDIRSTPEEPIAFPTPWC